MNTQIFTNLYKWKITCVPRETFCTTFACVNRERVGPSCTAHELPMNSTIDVRALCEEKTPPLKNLTVMEKFVKVLKFLLKLLPLIISALGEVGKAACDKIDGISAH